MNDGRKVHVEYLVEMKERGTFLQYGLIRVRGLRDPDWFGLTGHFR